MIYYMTSLVWLFFCLLPESDESSENLFDKSSENDEDEESDKFHYIYVSYGHVLVTLRLPLRILQLVDIQELVAAYLY